MQLERITEAIATMLERELEDEPYQHGGVEEVWHESANPMGDPDGELIGHMAFSVMTQSSPVTGQVRAAVGEIARCKSAIDVVFFFRIRPTDQLADERLAKRAAREILRAVNNESLWVDPKADVVVLLRQRYQPQFLLDREPYVKVTVGFDIEHDEEI